MKARTRMIMVALLILAAAFAGYKIYDYYQEDSMLYRIVTQDGYELARAGTPEAVSLEFKAQWLQTPDKKLNVPVGYGHQTLFVLEELTETSESATFSLKAIPELRKENGEFLYTTIIPAKGESVTPSTGEGWTMLDSSGSPVNVTGVRYKAGQVDGPSARFKLEIDKSELDKLQDGFTAAYSGFMLYSYTKN
ncbi:hypothetical protein [Paenibacillus nasutitermitis]|uniref:Uncharacterized protein n=1 Tax=Paenibacillus nasutitermitis TaxID=1652958 RepID=A0A916Z1H6_9BACL|nr:hypothetical protein [Paenibacillus nasutitermitis]GGD71483.1 hypothetical protein GCM10010911_31780 [Paenibacillus nasutitermitis]